MPIVRTDIPITWKNCEEAIRQIADTYPFCRTEQIGVTAFGRTLRMLAIGNGPRKVFYSAAHHANEWITTLVLLKYAEELAEAIQNGGELFGVPASRIAETATVYMVPMVDPDGVELGVGEIEPGTVTYETARTLADR